LESARSELEATRYDLGTVQSDLESARSVLDSTRADLEGQIQAWKFKYEQDIQKAKETQNEQQVDNSNQSSTYELQQLQQSKETWERQEKHLLNTIQTLQATNAHLSDQVTQLTSNLETIHNDYKVKHTQLHDQINSLQEQSYKMADTEQQYRNLLKDYEKMQKQCDDYRNQLESSNQQLQDIKQEMDKLQSISRNPVTPTSSAQHISNKSDQTESMQILLTELEGLKQEHLVQLMRADSLSQNNEALKTSIQLYQQENQEWATKYDRLTQETLQTETEWKQSLESLRAQAVRRDSELQMLLNERESQLDMFTNKFERQEKYIQTILVENQYLKQQTPPEIDIKTVSSLNSTFLHLKDLYRSVAEVKPTILSFKHDLAVLASFVQSEVVKLGFQIRNKEESFSLERSVLQSKIDTLQQTLDDRAQRTSSIQSPSTLFYMLPLIISNSQ
jgi:myosin heavy subunit